MKVRRGGDRRHRAKRAEDVQDVPVAVSVLRATDLEVLTVGTPDVQILSGRVPSLILESSFAAPSPRFYIRGLGNTDFDLNASQPVSDAPRRGRAREPGGEGHPRCLISTGSSTARPAGTLFGPQHAGRRWSSSRPSNPHRSPTPTSVPPTGPTTPLDFNFGIRRRADQDAFRQVSGLYQSQSDWVDNLYEPGPEDEIGGYETPAFRLQFLWSRPSASTRCSTSTGGTSTARPRIFRGNIIQQGSMI